MLKPPPVPSSYLDLPIAPAELQSAQGGVKKYGGRIQGALLVLVAVSLLSMVGSFAAAFWMWQALPDLFKSMELTVTPAEWAQARQAIPAWAWGLLGLFSLLLAAINIWCLLIARRVIGAVQRWTLQPSAESGAAVVRSARTVRPWLTLGQWTPVILGLAYALFYGAVFAMMGLGGEGRGSAGESALPLGFMLVSMVAYMTPGAVLTWLILGAIKRWLDAVTIRTTDPSFPVRPFARSVDGWLLFTLVMLVLGALNAVASTVMLAFFPRFMRFMLESDPTTKADAKIFESLAGLMQGLAGVTLIGAAVYVLLALLMGWSRAFANEVARVLDAGRPTQPVPVQAVPAVPSDW